MVSGQRGDRALSISDVSWIVADAARAAPEHIGLTFGDASITFGLLHRELDRLNTAMGGVLGADSLLPLVLADLTPGLLQSGEGALDRAVTSLLTEASAVLDIQWSTCGPAEGDWTLVHAFEDCVDRFPDRVALRSDAQVLTYAELESRANRVARYLLSQGVGSDRVVGLAVGRSIDLVVGMYGIIKAGGAYLPLDPDHPSDRLEYVLRIAEPVLVLTDEAAAASLPGTVPSTNISSTDIAEFDDSRLRQEERETDLRAENLAYVIFTSGSTGRPKGVAVPHSAISANLAWRQKHYTLHEDDVVLQKTPFTFDVSVWEFFWPLQIGAKLVLAEPNGHFDPDYLADLIRDAGVTVVHFVPSMLAVFVDSFGTKDLPSLRYLFASGEELTAATAARFAAISDAQLHNLYGPTEAAVDVTHHHVVDQGPGSVPIGTEVDDTELRVLGAGLEPVPPGTVGELYITGVQLARGYLSRPGTSSERFVADPFAAGSRMYRTGDLVKRTAGGILTYLGRTDFQVKLRGLRIELGEIEAILQQQNSVSQSAVNVRGDRLVGYVVPAGGGHLELDDLWASLRRALPAYMVPGALIVLDSMPLGYSGKLDRGSLPEPEDERREFSAPKSETEIAVAEEFSQLLGAEQVSRDDDFFTLGGNSLSATRLVARLNARYDVRIAVREFFDTATVAGWAALIDAAERHTDLARPALGSLPWPDQIPLSHAQQRMWFLNRLDPNSSVDNISVAIRLSGPLDVVSLKAAVGDLVARHASLRTRYPEIDGVGAQVIGTGADIDIDWVAQRIDEFELTDSITDAVTTPFDVAVAPPFRVRLLAVRPHEHVLVVVVHHIAADGFSMIPLTSDVMVAYAARVAGAAPAWTPLAVQYADYTLWQRQVLGASEDPTSIIRAQELYWISALSGLPDELALPTDRPRPPLWSGRGARHVLPVDSETHRLLVELARRRGCTPFMVMHAALTVLLARASGISDFAVGTPVAGRGEAVLDDVIGMFVNTLVLRAHVDGSSSFDEVLAGVREVDLSAFAHADVPFERVVEVVDPPRSQGRHPIFQVLLTFRDVGESGLELDGLSVGAVDIDVAMAKVDLDFTVSEHRSAEGGPAGMSIAITYATDLFDTSTASSLASRLSAVLDAVAENSSVIVGDIDLLQPAERAWLVTELNATDHDIDSSATLVSMFRAQSAMTPDAVAVVFEGDRLSYRQFDARVNRLARYLIGRGVGPETNVAVALNRSLDLLTAIYAVITAGGAYVPVDPEQPADRIAYIFETAGVDLVIADSDDAGSSWPAAVIVLDDEGLGNFSEKPMSDADRLAPLSADNSAYVLFTSGSTGRPKGVSVSHSAIVNRLVWMQSEYALTQSDAVVQKTPVTFDVSVWELFWPLQVGARLVIARPEGHRDPIYLTELIANERVSVAHFVPSMLAVFAAEVAPGQTEGLRWVFSSGEALPVSTAQALLSAVPSARLANLYGPTEAAVDVTFHEFSAGDVNGVPIGVPVFNTRVHVLDGRLHPVSVGTVGELYLGGVQLARGYASRPDLTADRFIADPFGLLGGRLYRTGDLVRWSSTGELEYVGRSDFQVKLRGLRIELGEIENALSAADSVSQAVVAVRKERLVAYVVPEAGKTIDTDALRARAAITLPEYMVPAVVLVVDAFPLGPTGKLDRKSLPEPLFELREFREPASETERVIASVFGEILGVPTVGLDDDFFALGGNSLLATQVVSRIGAQLDARVPVRSIFDASTVVGLAALVQSSVGTGGRIPLVAGTRPRNIPLSLAQQRMWFLDKFEPHSAAYNIPIVVRLQGDLDVPALMLAIDDVRRRHEPLRTVYPEVDGVGYQVIMPVESSAFVLGVDDCSEAEASRLIRDMVVEGFEPALSAPFRAHLYRLGRAEGILAVVVHHIAADGFSVGPLMRDVVVAYAARAAGAEPAWQPLPVQYADYAVWQRQMLGDEADADSLISRQVRFWTRQLHGVPEQGGLPTDRPRPTVPTERGGVHAFGVNGGLHRSVVALGLELGCTPFMIVHAAFAILLARMSSSSDIVIGTPTAGRGEQALDDVIGMFVNTLVLRAEVRDFTSVRDLLASIREVDLDAFANADIPFERLVEILDPPRSTARQPLFQVMLAFQNLERIAVELPNISATGVEFETGLSKFDLYLTMSEDFDSSGEPLGMQAQFLYLTDLFDESTIAAAGQRFLRILGAMVADPSTVVGEIDVLVGHELQSVVHEWNRTDTPMTDELLLDRYQERVASSPNAVAITFEGESITYGEFDSRVDRLARYLMSEGIGPESTVAVAMARSVELIVGIYAIVKAGAAYVPVDPHQPHDRVQNVLETAGVSIVLSTSRDGVLGDGFRVIEVDGPVPGGPVLDRSGGSPVADGPAVRPDGAAYVLFTSGSTGQPKGVVVSHRAIVNRLNWMQSEYGLVAGDAVVQKTPVTFDVSVWELFWPLQIGARMVIAKPDGHRDPAYLADIIRSESVTVAHFVPSMLAVFAADPAVNPVAPSGSSLRWIFASGEALPASTARESIELLPSARLVNLYGPTEAAVDVTIHEFAETDTVSVPIGRPVAGTRVYVLDGRLRPVAPSVVGELYLAGVQLARGYVGKPDLSSERFVADPFDRQGGRLYRTGDLVRWTRTGELDYVGRADFQVKLRGQRIELGEIESALAALPAIAQAVVVLRSNTTIGEILVGYVVPEAGATVDPVSVRAALAKTIPDFMIPTSVLVLEAMPLGPNGKLDRRALPEPTFQVKVFRPPSTPIEETVAEIYRDLLGADRIGLDDDFFALGGNSLTATRVVARLGAALGVEVPLRTLFEAPSVGLLAGRVDHERGSTRRPAISARQARDVPVPLSLAQQRMWFLNRLEPYSAVNNVPVTIRLTGELDRDAFVRAFHDVTARHDILRTVYPDIDGVGYQVIEPIPADSVVLHVEEATPSQSAERVLSMVASGFDVTAGVPVRAVLLRETSTRHVLVLVAHHISVDGFSIGPLTHDLVRAYAARALGQEPGWERHAVQYADYAIWQREVLGSEDDPSSIASKQIDYWRTQLADLPDEIELPTDRPRPTEQSTLGAALSVSIDSALRARISAFAYSAGVTPFMVLHSAFAVLLARLSASEDVAIGTPVAGRGDSELDDMIGMFVNTLVLRSPVNPATTFTALVSEVREIDLSAFAHADIPFERIVDVVDPHRARGRHPLFQVMFTFQNLGQAHLELPNLTISGVEFDSVHAKFDLQVTLSDTYSSDENSTAGEVLGWNVEFIYATDLFDRPTVERFAAGFLRLVSGLLDSPNRPVGDIESMPGDERDRLVHEWSSSGLGTGRSNTTLVDRFAAAVESGPDRIAVRFDGRSWSYAEVEARVNALAHHLISLGAGPETLVAVALPRSIDMVVALLAVSTAGAGYLPVDPSYPKDRIEFMIGDANPVVVLASGSTTTSTGTFGSVPVLDLDGLDLANMDQSAVTDEDRHAPLTSANLAYVIYTSGSTGKPKGVAVTHENVLQLFANTGATFGFDADDVWTMFHSYAFDFSVWEMWGPLLHGGSLVVVDYYTSRSPEAFRELLTTEQVTVLNQTPSAFYQLDEIDSVMPAARLALRYILFGGEALEPRRLHNWFDRRGDGTGDNSGPTLVNLYGITETTVHVSTRMLSSRDVLPSSKIGAGSKSMIGAPSASIIGAPIPGLRVYVLDRRLRPAPVGVAGEMYIAGGQLARGYVGRPGMSAVRFVADPFGDEGSVLYRTGDLARWVESAEMGELEYLGRADEQVKVRGFRIELGEVEAAVSARPEVSSVAVIVRDVPPTGVQLVAYVVLVDAAEADLDELRRGVGDWVPDYMVPSAFVPIGKIPLTLNGKLDRSALPSPTFIESEFRAPSNAIEEVVAGVFAEILGMDRVGADDDFFALGGNSLVATRVVSRLGSALDTVVAVRVLFEASTVSELAAHLGTDVGAGGQRKLVARTRPEIIPLSFAQQRMWVLNRLDPTSGAYNIPVALRLSGDLDTAALALALEDVISRHETLRTRYPEVNGVGSQQVVSVADIELDATPEPVGADEVLGRVRSILTTSFDVAASVPLLVRVLELSDIEHVVVLVVHHIAADGFSLGPLTRDLMTAYAARSQGRMPEWAPLEVQYADYVLWHRDILGDEDDPSSILFAQGEFWRAKLATLEEQSGLSTDRPRPKVPSGVGAIHEFVVDGELLKSLETVVREHNSTLFMGLHAAVAILLAKLSGAEDIAVGTPVAGRGESALDNIVGMFVNTLVLRTSVSPDETVSDILRSARETDLDAFAHADVPFERIVELVDPPRSASKSPFFQIAVALQNHGATSLELPGLSISALESVDHTANYDLQIVFSDRYSDSGEAALTCTIVYATDLYDRATVELFAQRLTSVLNVIAQSPETTVEDIDISTVDEGIDIFAVDEDTIGAVGSSFSTLLPHIRTLPQMLEAAVEAEPDAPAIVVGETETSYLAASAHVGRLARFLVSQGIGPGQRVVVDIPLSAPYVVAAWAVWSSGAAVVWGATTGSEAQSSPGASSVCADVVLTTTAAAGLLHDVDTGLWAADQLRTIVLDAGDVASAIEAQSSRSVDYASRTRTLVPEDDAFIVIDTAGETVLSHRDVVVRAAACVQEWAVTYESRIFVALSGLSAPVGAWQGLVIVVAASAGAAVVVGADGADPNDVIERSWVTHVFAGSSVVLEEDQADLDAVVRTDGDAPAPWLMPR